MPQPVKTFNNIYPTEFAIGTHPNTTFAQQFANIVGIWTVTEQDMSNLALDILGLHGEAALPLYMTLQSGKTQRDAIESLVRANIAADRIADFEEVWRRLNSCRKQRNTIVHGTWALSDDYPEDLILIDHKEELTRRAVSNAYTKTKDPKRLLEIGLTHKNLMRYTTADFGDIIRRISGARHSLLMFQVQEPLPVREP